MREGKFLRLSVNDSYNMNMNNVDIADQLRGNYRTDRWMRKLKWWWALFFWGHNTMLVNAYVCYKVFMGNNGKTLGSHYEFWKMVVLAKVSPADYGADKQQLPMAVQRRDHRFRTRTPSSSKRSISSLSSVSFSSRKKVKNDKCNYATVKRVSEDRSHLNITRLDLTLRHPPEPNLRSSRNPSGICCFLWRWATGKKLSSQLLRCVDCNVSLCSWCYGLYHTTSVIDKNMKSWLANEIEKRKNTAGQSKKKGKTTKKWCACGYIVVCVVLKLSIKNHKKAPKRLNRLVPSTYSINLNVTS